MVDIGGISETAAAKAKELAAFASEKAKSTLDPVYDRSPIAFHVHAHGQCPMASFTRYLYSSAFPRRGPGT